MSIDGDEELSLRVLTLAVDYLGLQHEPLLYPIFCFCVNTTKLGAINVHKMSQTTTEVWKDSYLRLRM